MQIHNFNPGPSYISKFVIEKSIEGIKNYNNSGLSVLEISHRSSAFLNIIEQAKELSLALTGLDNKNYSALFLQGGASTQFLMTAINFLKTKAGYINTGSWSEKAIKEAKNIGTIEEISSSKDKNFSYIPETPTIDSSLDYLHLTSNNTIFGTQYNKFPATTIPLFADMSSDILCRELDYSKFDLVYAGAQKNLGIAGTTLVIIKNELLEKINTAIPSILSYKDHVEKDSLLNTPPVFPIYVSLLTLQWIKEQGGVKEIEKRNREKAELLYNEIDTNPLFNGFANEKDRSLMNVTFTLADEKHEQKFQSLCDEYNINGVKGHRSVGGYRASIYNALSIESVETLVDCMQKLKQSI